MTTPSPTGKSASPPSDDPAETISSRIAERSSHLLLRPADGDSPPFSGVFLAGVSRIPGSSRVSDAPGASPSFVMRLRSGALRAVRITGVLPPDPGLFLQSASRAIENVADRKKPGEHLIRALSLSFPNLRPKLLQWPAFPAPAFFSTIVSPIVDSLVAADPEIPGLPWAVRREIRRRALETSSFVCAEAFSLFLLESGEDCVMAASSSSPSCLLEDLDDLVSDQGFAARNRRQAATAAPSLSFLLGARDAVGTRLRNLVDDGAPLWPALADCLGAPEETVRWMARRPIPQEWNPRPRALASLLSAIAPQKRPACESDWDFLSGLHASLSRVPGELASPWYAEIFKTGLSKFSKTLADEGLLISDLAESSDLVREAFRHLYAKSFKDLFHGDPFEHPAGIALARAFSEGAGIRRQIRASRDWHRMIMGFEPTGDAPEAPPEMRIDSWPVPFRELKLSRGCRAVFLSTAGELAEEGSVMNHCVGGYSHQCSTGRSVIASIRSPSSRSTAEFRLEKTASGGFAAAVAQNKSFSNAHPPPLLHGAAAEICSILSDPRNAHACEASWAAFQKRIAAQRERDTLMSGGPMDPGRSRILSRALSAHRGLPFLEQAFLSAIGRA